MKSYKLLNEIVEIKNPWVHLFGERVVDENGRQLDYWRVERPDSVLVIPFTGNDIFLPPPFYRHGAGCETYDFPGGRVNPDIDLEDSALAVLEKELGIKKNAVGRLDPINQQGWLVDSSFSTQRVYGFSAFIPRETDVAPDLIGMREPVNTEGIKNILDRLVCLQCRHALLEWAVIRQNVNY